MQPAPRLVHRLPPGYIRVAAGFPGRRAKARRMHGGSMLFRAIKTALRTAAHCALLALFALPAAAQTGQYMKVDMKQAVHPVRPDPGEFGPEIGLVRPGQCVMITGQAMERSGANWLEVESARGWYDRIAGKAYAKGWVPSAILSDDPGCEQALELGNSIRKAVQPGLDTAAAGACANPGASQAFVQFTLNQPGLIRWLARWLDNSVLYVTSDAESDKVRGIRTPPELILELTGLPMSLYIDCGTSHEAQLLNIFEFSDLHGDTPICDRLKVSMNTGTGQILTFTFERDLFKLMGVVDRGWKITEVTRLAAQ